MTSVFLLLLTVATALSISFLCSLLEATLLSVPVMTLAERAERGDGGAARMLRLKQERIDDAISAILILNTVAHTIGAAVAGAQAAVVFGSAWVGLFSCLLTLAVLVFTEIIPKTLGTVHATRLVGFVAWVTELLTRLLKYPLSLTRLLTRLLSRREKRPISRAELAAMVAMARREGTLPDAESKMVAGVLRYHEIKVEDVMTPRTVVAMAPAAATLSEFLADDNAGVFSRIPLYEGTPDHVIGYVLRAEALSAAATGADPSTPLLNFRRDVLHIPESQTVGGALMHMTHDRESMALVTDEYGGISGLVTVEDLVESTLGIEIIDESDRVVDLRAEAVKLREKRLQSLRTWRLALDGGGGAAAAGDAPKIGRPSTTIITP
jgi:CBS domain containing-hemolysin-like protein